MKNFKKYFVLLAFVFIAGSLVVAKPCIAAGATIDITSDKPTVTVGDLVQVFINIDSQTTFTDFVANLSYDPAVLEYKGVANKISGGNGKLLINDVDVMKGSIKRKYALQFKALKVGVTSLSLEDEDNNSPIVYDESGNELSVSTETLSVTVKAKVTASTNANLKSLSTEPAMNPKFNKNVHEYSVNVDNKTDQLFIVANPEDKKSTVSITGNDSLQEGINKVVIKVLAESGNNIEYIINVNKEKAPEITPTPAAETVSTASSVKIVQDGADQYLVFNGSYKIILDNEEVDIPEGYVKTNITISGEAVPAYVLDNNMQNDFVLIYVENGDGEKGFYQYDKIEKTLQRFTNNLSGNSASDNKSGEIEQYRNNLNKAAIVIAILSAVSVLLLFTSIKLLSKKKRRRR